METDPVVEGRRRDRWLRPRLTARQVDVALGVAVAGAILTGLLSWSVGDRWNGWATTVHGTFGITLVLLLPAKLRGSARTGLKRGRSSRWLSIVFGVLVLATVTLGLLHGLGLWHGVGQWSALWTHELFGFLTLPLLAWHLLSRPARPGVRDLDRRAVLGLGVTAGAAAGLYVLQRPVARLAGLDGGDRRHTGSHEVASHDPERMPTVIWFNDERPDDVASDTWDLAVDGRPLAISELRRRARPLLATLDCTGGWYSEQSWDVVPLDELLPEPRGRSIRVRSATGYDRRFPLGDVGQLHLAVGYEGRPLLPGHGAPVRLVVPGRRGPDWVKWVSEVAYDDRPSWLQSPLPLT